MWDQKTKSLRQISKKSSVLSRDHSFDLIYMKHNQNVCSDVMFISIEYGLYGSKTRSLGQISLNLCVH